MRISSPQFENEEMIPKKYTCEGEDTIPPLNFEDIPDNAESLVLIVDDPDAPAGTWTHWVVYDIDPNDNINENQVPAKQGLNDFDKKNYGGPCPPSGTHRYFFRAFALDKKINQEGGLSRKQVEQEIEGHVIESSELIGLYKKQR